MRRTNGAIYAFLLVTALVMPALAVATVGTWGLTSPARSVSDATFFALSQHRRLAAAGNCNPIFDAHGPAVSLIEHSAAGLVANRKDEFLPFLDVGAGLEDHVDRYARRRNLLGRKNTVAIYRIVGTEIVILEDQPRAWRCDVDVWIVGRRRSLAVRGPGSEQIEMPE